MAFKIFISHVWRRQHTSYWHLIRLLGDAKRFRFVDLSIPKLRPFDGPAYEAVRDDILRILRTADVVLVINTPIITNSTSVRDELREAEEQGIPIIAINPPARHGAARTSRLDVIRRAYKAHWTTDSIVTAIRAAVREGRTVPQAASNLIADAMYQPIADAAAEAPQDVVVRGRDDEEELITPMVTTTQDFMHASHATPTAAAESTQIPGQEHTSPKRPWFRRLWRWLTGAQ